MLAALAPTPAPAGAFDVALVAKVFAGGLAFTAPRALDPVTVGDLAAWGLGGINALDPALMASLEGHRVRLVQTDHTLLERAVPDANDATGWGTLAASMEQSAFDASPLLRRAGQQALIQSFFDEAFNRLDPYSRYVPPAPAEDERAKLSIDANAGIRLVRRGNEFAVSDVVPGGPGAASDVRVGDRLVRIDGRKLRGMSLAGAQALLHGEDGDTARLGLLGLDGRAREVTVTLGFVPPETVFSRRQGDVTVLRISAFVANTAERLSQAIEAALAGPQPPAAFVVDLRGNRGGLLRQAVTGVALFADQGVIASTAGRDPQAAHDWRIDGGGDLTGGAPVIVLVDGRTASAAEIMAAALADLGRAVVVGSDTLGKGLVQTLAQLPDGGELYVSWSRVLAPRGWPIQGLGVMPQLCTSLGQMQILKQLRGLDNGELAMSGAVAATRAARAPLPAAEVIELRAPCPAAEGSDADLQTALYLAAHPDAYRAALLAPQGAKL